MRSNHQNGTRTGRTALGVAAYLILTASATSAAPRVVLLVEDARGMPIISGESTEPNYPAWIDAIAIGTGFDKLPSSDASHTARRARLVVPNAFVITKRPDKSSPKLQEALFKGEELPVVRIKYLTDDPGPASEPIMIELRQVHVVEYETGNGRSDPVFSNAPSGGIPTELVALSFREIRWLYRFQDPATGKEEEEESHWDAFYTTASPDEDSDGDGINNADDPDDDNDGIPDDEELAASLNPLVDDRLFDFDQDNDLNVDEWRAGTDPNSGHSFFGIASFGLRDDPGGLAVTVQIPVIGGRTYRLLGSFSLTDPDGWFVLGEFPIPPDTPGELMEFELPPGVVPLLPRLFFKASVEFDSDPGPPD